MKFVFRPEVGQRLQQPESNQRFITEWRLPIPLKIALEITPNFEPLFGLAMKPQADGRQARCADDLRSTLCT